MSSEDHAVLQRQLPAIKQIVHNETWYEGERRGQPVDPRDPVVVERVCEIIQREGAAMRRRAEQALAWPVTR